VAGNLLEKEGERERRAWKSRGREGEREAWSEFFLSGRSALSGLPGKACRDRQKKKVPGKEGLANRFEEERRLR